MRRLFAQIAAGLAVVLLAMPALADDGQIAKQIIARLKQQKQAANLTGFDLGVQVDNGTVTMMGQVASPEQAMLALDTARRIPGVKLVVNDLLVNAPTAKQAAPTPIAQRPVQRPVQQMLQPQQPQMAQQSAIRPVAAQQVIPYQPAGAHYNATGAIGSAVAPAAPQRPVAFAPSMIRQASAQSPVAPANYVTDGSYGGEIVGGGYAGPSIADNPSVPTHAWPSYATSPNYGAVSYPQQYSATAWPYIGPFYPYPQVPLGWRKVSLEWDDGWWFLDFTKK